MSQAKLDVAIIGGGLAGGLTALAIRNRWPDARFALIEAKDHFGGNHRWSWFGTDLDSEAAELIGTFPAEKWSDNEVRFPTYFRVLSSSYHSLSSRDFDGVLRRVLPQESIRLSNRVTAVEPGRVTLANGETILARHIVDCRDGGPGLKHLRGGWQAFLGQLWELDEPHGVSTPIIMDATVDQPGSYRFVYVLPMDESRIFIEDTYYQDDPGPDVATLRQRIIDYAAQHGWRGMPIDEETGCLPVVTGGDFRAFRKEAAQPGVVRAGAGGGFIHPLTSYTIPIAVRTALDIAANIDLEPEKLAQRIEKRSIRHWQATGHYRMLGQMLFAAADPSQRYLIFQRFYSLNEKLIERFYSARSRLTDKIRILSGKPPVPVFGAIGALLTKRPALTGLHKPAEHRKADAKAEVTQESIPQ